MHIVKFLFILIITLLPMQLLAQEDEPIIDPVLVFFKGRLLDKLTGEPVAYANVVNLRTKGGTTTDIYGYFSMELLNVDTMMVSVLGYKKDRLTIPLKYREGVLQEYQIEAIRFPISEVEISGKRRELSFGDLGTGKVDSISPEYRSTTWSENPKWWQALLSPISFIEYHGKAEKQRRLYRETLATEQDWKRLSKYYNQEMVQELTGLKGASVDSFMIYFNAENKLTGRSSEYEVREAIANMYRQYMQEKYGNSHIKYLEDEE